jgi:hypothetical protein
MSWQQDSDEVDGLRAPLPPMRSAFRFRVIGVFFKNHSFMKRTSLPRATAFLRRAREDNPLHVPADDLPKPRFLRRFMKSART